jgi:hypothetical protein
MQTVYARMHTTLNTTSSTNRCTSGLVAAVVVALQIISSKRNEHEASGSRVLLIHNQSIVSNASRAAKSDSTTFN